MALGLESPGVPSAAPVTRGAAAALHDTIWQAPLVPAAIALTCGIVLDRHGQVSLAVSLLVAAGCLIAWILTRTGRSPTLPLAYLALSLAAIGAAYHHAHCHLYPASDIGNFATPEPRPARLLGILAEEPVVIQRRPGPLQSYARPNATSTVLRVSHLRQGDHWNAVSGNARMIVDAELTGLHVGDEVEVVGTLTAPSSPANPGEFDHAAFLNDQRIRAEVHVRQSAAAVHRTSEGWSGTLAGWLAVTRGWGQRALAQALPAESSGVAAALLLGEGSTMTSDGWQKYIRTGVIHVLAISGQHLVILATFLWGLLRVLGVRRRRGAWIVAALLFAYALLAGGRPPVLRAAIMVCVACGGIILRRATLSANSLALAWIVIALLSPTDIFSIGCQISFLVVVIYWGASRWFHQEADQLDLLVDESRSVLVRLLISLGKTVAVTYTVTFVIWLVIAPLVAARQDLVSPIAVVIGPPMVLLTSIALLAGFLLLLAWLICWPLVPIFAWVTHYSLAGAEWLVDVSDRPPLYFYVGDVPAWWLWVFYLALLVFLTVEALQRRRTAVALAGLAWLCVGLAATLHRPADDGLRCTFLAVGHGGCTVLETPEGRTLVYDAGALRGPEVTRRVIAPFLWQRGIRRIDEVFLSHADLDHFNGLPALIERFPIGLITCTPTFADRSTAGVGLTLDAIHRHAIPTRIVRAGDRLTSGAVTFDVLHPPEVGPEGKENVRSLVLLVRHAEQSILLTGDLEQAGLERVLSLPTTPVDVLMAPHHGSRTANTASLARWASPKVVVSSQGPPRGQASEPYSAAGATFLSTWPHGAVIVRSRDDGMTVETFRSARHIEVETGRGRLPPER